VACLDEGRLAELGAPHELLARRDSVFAALRKAGRTAGARDAVDARP
jgi:hypothetical protein